MPNSPSAAHVTVIVPCHDNVSFLSEALQSLERQTLKEHKLLFIDDSSNGEGLDIVRREYRGPQLEIVSTEELGIPAVWNFAASLVETKYFCFLHSDDRYAPDYLEKMVGLLERYPSASLAHCAVRVIDEYGTTFSSPVDEYKHDNFFDSQVFLGSGADEYRKLLAGNYINCPSVMYRNSAFCEFGNFDISLRQAPDWNYWLRAVDAGGTLLGTSDRLYEYRRHGQNASVVNAASMVRYEEELQVLIEATRIGFAKNWCPEVPRLGIVRNIILYDYIRALAQGQNNQAANLLRYMHSNELVNPVTYALLSTLKHIGSTGNKLLVVLANAALYLRGIYGKLT